MHRGVARYHLGNVFLASSKKSTEPEKEEILSNWTTAMKSRPDSSKLYIKGYSALIDIKRNTVDTKLMTHDIRKTADVRAREIFVFISSSPQF